MARRAAKKELLIPSDLSGVRGASQKVLSFLKPLSPDEAFIFDVRLCLEEALINAMKYGNRLQKELPVRLTVEVDEKKVRITIEDQGEGFDAGRLQDCTKGDNLLKGGGRGIYLIHQLMDEVKYNSKGNCLSMTKRFRKARRMRAK